MRKILTMTLAMLSAICLLAAVGCNESKTHNFSSTYEFDETMHWQKCTDEGCEERVNYNEHSFQLIGTANSCSVCGYSYNTANTYEVNLETMGGTVLKGVTVNLFDDSNAKISSGKSNVRGKVRFTDISPDDYVAKIDESTLPKGYYLSDDLKEINLSSSFMKTTVKIPSKLIDEEMPTNNRYSLGSIAYNFKTTSVDIDGKVKNISLSAYLSRYNAVVLNFWYSGCGPCMSEFPFMSQAYDEYSDKIAVIAINNGYDSPEGIASFVKSSQYHFDFVNDQSMFSYHEAFGVQAFPTTVVVDKYGAIAHIESGSLPSHSAWANLFEHYISEDYVPDYLSGYTDSNGGNGGDGGNELLKPDVDMPESQEIAEKITTVNSYTDKDTFTFSNEENDQYSWPWILEDLDGETCLKTSNKDKVNSYSILFINVNLKAGQQVFADLYVSTELEEDILYLQVDTVLQYTLSGEENYWRKNQLLYVAERDGKYQISLIYQKNLMNNPGKDSVYIKNLHIEENAEINKNYDLVYNAVDNYTLDETIKIPGEYKGYLNHIDYYYNQTDGFYHVALFGSEEAPDENDPVLMADLYYTTPWNKELSVWNLAYAEVGLFGETDENYMEGYVKAVEDYAWIQNNNATRYVPVNKELHDILVNVVTDLGRTDHSEDPHNGIDQWLEVCRYYVHYGNDNSSDHICFSLDNTVEALKWRVAKDCGTIPESGILELEVDVYSVHLPRGNYYKFKTTKSGAYCIYSTARFASDYDLEGIDPLGFVCDAKGNILAENDNFYIEVMGYDDDDNPIYDNNFYMFVYLKANTEYQVAGCFNDPYAMGKYGVKVEYIGEEHKYFTSCANDPTYTYDENDPNFTPIIIPKMGKDRFFIGDDGNYYAQEYDGSQGSLIYIRLIGPTYYNSYSNHTLEELIENDQVGETEEDRLFMRHMLVEARTAYPEDHELYGYVVATEKLVAIINKRANGEDTEEDNTYSQTSWLLTAYYYRNVNELTLEEATAKFDS